MTSRNVEATLKISSRKSGCRLHSRLLASVSLLVVFILATHTFWCSAMPVCADGVAPAAPSHREVDAQCVSPVLPQHCQTPSQPEEHHHESCCGGIDETQTAFSLHRLTLRPVDAVVIDIASVLPAVNAPLLRAAHLYRRDGPEVRVLRSHLCRNTLLGRAPPASV